MDVSEVVIRARNNAADSENRIHADDVARQHGFRGGLVPGVTVYAYMGAPVVAVLGPDWSQHGTMSARFVKPVYDGDELTVSAASVDEEDGHDCCAPPDPRARAQRLWAGSHPPTH